MTLDWPLIVIAGLALALMALIYITSRRHPVRHDLELDDENSTYASRDLTEHYRRHEGQ